MFLTLRTHSTTTSTKTTITTTTTTTATIFDKNNWNAWNRYRFTAWKVFVFGVFLASLFLHSNWIRREIPYLSVYSVRMREIPDQKNSKHGHFLRSDCWLQVPDTAQKLAFSVKDHITPITSLQPRTLHKKDNYLYFLLLYRVCNTA